MHSRLRSLRFILKVSLPQSLLNLRAVSLAIPDLALSVPTEAQFLQGVPNRHGGLVLKTDLHLPVPLGDGVSPICGRYGLLFALLGGFTRIFSRILHVTLFDLPSRETFRMRDDQTMHSLLRDPGKNNSRADRFVYCLDQAKARLPHSAESGYDLPEGHPSGAHHFRFRRGCDSRNALLRPVAFLCGGFRRGGFICPHLLGRGFCGGFRGFRGLLDWHRGRLGGRIIDYIRKRNVPLRLQLLCDLLQQLHVALALGIGDIGNIFSLSLMQNRPILPNELDQLLRGDLLTPTLAHPLFQLLRHLVVGIQLQGLIDKRFLNALAVNFAVSLTETVVIPRNGDIVRN